MEKGIHRCLSNQAASDKHNRIGTKCDGRKEKMSLQMIFKLENHGRVLTKCCIWTTPWQKNLWGCMHIIKYGLGERNHKPKEIEKKDFMFTEQ